MPNNRNCYRQVPEQPPQPAPQWLPLAPVAMGLAVVFALMFSWLSRVRASAR